MASNEAGAVVFRREPRVSRLHDPRKEFALTDVESEIRYDPLTGESSRICHFSLTAAAPSDIAAIAEARGPSCPFCPDGSIPSPRASPRAGPGRTLPARRRPSSSPTSSRTTTCRRCSSRRPAHLVRSGDLPESLVTAGVGAARDFLAPTLPRLGGRPPRPRHLEPHAAGGRAPSSTRTCRSSPPPSPAARSGASWPRRAAFLTPTAARS